jgi:hypothetical protein
MVRRIFTDGRKFPNDEEPSWMGYSIGRWIDQDNGSNALRLRSRALGGARYSIAVHSRSAIRK